MTTVNCQIYLPDHALPFSQGIFDTEAHTLSGLYRWRDLLEMGSKTAIEVFADGLQIFAGIVASARFEEEWEFRLIVPYTRDEVVGICPLEEPEGMVRLLLSTGGHADWWHSDAVLTFGSSWVKAQITESLMGEP